MLFSSLTDPVDIARAEAAFEAAWEELRSTISDVFDERKRTKLACIVAALVAIAQDEDDRKRRVHATAEKANPLFPRPPKEPRLPRGDERKHRCEQGTRIRRRGSIPTDAVTRSSN